MKNTYKDFLKRIYALTRFGEKMSLDGPKALHRSLGRPLNSYPSILVAGTNGKGSTCAFLERLLRDCGLTTGLFTSPHLNSFTERIRINGRPVDEEWLQDNSAAVLHWAERHGGSFFEAAWGLATLAFEQETVDVAIWEVGLGGRLDATNVAKPLISCITNIALDHTRILGPRLDDIAREKSAIFKSADVCLSSATGAGLVALKESSEWGFEEVPLLDLDVPISLPGKHQRLNASLAWAAADAYGLAPSIAALANTNWPGRCEYIDTFILDAAHNPAALLALSNWVSEQGLSHLHVIFGVMEGKDYGKMASIIESFAGTITLVTPDYPRRIPAPALRASFTRQVDIIEPVNVALDMAPKNVKTLVCGSSFLIAEARAHLLGLEYPECGLRTLAR